MIPIKEARDILDTYDMEQPICIDVETISWDDARAADNPYRGDRVGVFLLWQDNKQPVAMCVRHRRAQSEAFRMYDLDEALGLMRDFCSKVKIYVNQNIKFDLRFMACDGIQFPIAEFRDTIVMARLHRNDRMSYKLSELARIYNPNGVQKAVDLISKSLAQFKSKDYGVVPVDTITSYGIDDVYSTLAVHDELLKLMPAETVDLMKVEFQFTRLLFESEHHGIHCDTQFLMRKRIDGLHKIIALSKEINAHACHRMPEVRDKKGNLKRYEFNPRSSQQKSVYFSKLGVKPIKYTVDPNTGKNTDNPSWDAEVLEQINPIEHGSSREFGEEAFKMAKLLLKLSNLNTQDSMFLSGWLDRHVSGVIRPDYKQAGTKTGRLSCGDPNAQNLPEWMLEAMVIPDGKVGVKWDLSQIEYRLFAHYSKDEKLVQQYLNNPLIDFHQIKADDLGIPRKPVKPINFGIMYGMGEAKLVRSIYMAIIEFDSAEFRGTIQKYSKEDLPEFPVTIPAKQVKEIASNVLAEYHVKTPGIKYLNKVIKELLYARGYIKSFYGMHYHMPAKLAYVGTNALIQGTAAQFFKHILVKVHEQCKEAQLINNVHDCDMSIMDYQHIQKFYDVSKRVIEDTPFKVPIRMDAEVAIDNWHNSAKIINGDAFCALHSLMEKTHAVLPTQAA